mmetsp:Transcript_66038/g.190538  ORF Transcript_66038/g.190538 Transcript_66038/m.190538 type:complete len:211 (+) Transcript_66038:2260-2892(+)
MQSAPLVRQEVAATHRRQHVLQLLHFLRRAMQLEAFQGRDLQHLLEPIVNTLQVALDAVCARVLFPAEGNVIRLIKGKAVEQEPLVLRHGGLVHAGNHGFEVLPLRRRNLEARGERERLVRLRLLPRCRSPLLDHHDDRDDDDEHRDDAGADAHVHPVDVAGPLLHVQSLQDSLPATAADREESGGGIALGNRRGDGAPRRRQGGDQLHC